MILKIFIMVLCLTYYLCTYDFREPAERADPFAASLCDNSMMFAVNRKELRHQEELIIDHTK
ncbi:unnamed protein product [Chironomus riparius]|uniref:Uncharacterized protein n=1 Tax=Chironomus riparius TaxID=315576 RepID=A0A9N9S0G8_9DIPT|nr:unnamed protein product [Chironomus riparius]